MRIRRLMTGVAAIAVASLVLTACGDDSSSSDDATDGGGGDKGEIVIGSAGFTEIDLMAQMYSALLEDAGYTPTIETVENRELYEPALEAGDIDVVPDYLATMAEFLNTEVNGPDAELIATPDAAETADAIAPLAEERGLVVLEPAEAVDQNAFVVTTEFAEENDLTTLSDLGELGESLVLAATVECPERPFCQIGLEETYGLTISSVLPTGFGSPQTKSAVQDGQAQLGLTGTTDATLDDFGLVVLEDDQDLQLADNLVPIINADLAEETDLIEALNSLASVLTTEDLTELIGRVDNDRERAEDVARDYLEEKELIG